MASVIEIDDLTVSIETEEGVVPVLEHLSFAVAAGETVALVGESGCGKSITALAIMGLLPPGFRRASGRILLEGEDIASVGATRLRELRGNRMSMIFQEPMTALNPVYSVGDQISEALRLHQGLSRRAALDRALEMLRAVQIPAPESRLGVFPHQLSGGMRQRVMIAMALACRPKLLIADEPTTALDVTVQAQVFDLLESLQEEFQTAILLITHDLGAVADIADHVAVLYAGRCVEKASTAEIMQAPLHPYTRGLIACVPRLQLGPVGQRSNDSLVEIPGMVPPLGQRPETCAFASRCPCADDTCRTRRQPELVGAPHAVACWHSAEQAR